MIDSFFISFRNLWLFFILIYNSLAVNLFTLVFLMFILNFSLNYEKFKY